MSFCVSVLKTAISRAVIGFGVKVYGNLLVQDNE